MESLGASGSRRDVGKAGRAFNTGADAEAWESSSGSESESLHCPESESRPRNKCSVSLRLVTVPQFFCFQHWRSSHAVIRDPQPLLWQVVADDLD
eukprot:3389400-Rhodomonas_salina.2